MQKSIRVYPLTQLNEVVTSLEATDIKGPATCAQKCTAITGNDLTLNRERRDNM